MVLINDLELKGLECHEGCHILLCDFYRKEYEAIFYNIFDFSFNRELFNQTGELGSCLYSSFSIVNNTSLIYGLKLQGEFFFKTEALSITNKSLECGNPVVILSSTLYCPWLKQYSSIDKPRSLLVFDSGYNWLDVIDTTLDRQRIKRLFLHDLPPKKVRVCKAVLSPYNTDHLKLSRMMTTHLKGLNFQCFEDCSSVIQKLKSIDQEFNTANDNTWNNNADIFFGRHLPNSSRHFAQFLKWLEDKLYEREVFDFEYQILKQISQDWMMFRNLLFRCKLRGNFGQGEKIKLCVLLEEICRKYQCVVDSVINKIG